MVAHRIILEIIFIAFWNNLWLKLWQELNNLKISFLSALNTKIKTKIRREKENHPNILKLIKMGSNLINRINSTKLMKEIQINQIGKAKLNSLLLSLKMWFRCLFRNYYYYHRFNFFYNSTIKAYPI